MDDVDGPQQERSGAGGGIENRCFRQTALQAEFFLQLLVNAAAGELNEFRRRVENAASLAVQPAMLGEEVLEEVRST